MASTLEGVKEQGDKLTNVLEEMQKSQVEQMKMMSQFMGAMVEAMKNAKKLNDSIYSKPVLFFCMGFYCSCFLQI